MMNMDDDDDFDADIQRALELSRQHAQPPPPLPVPEVLDEPVVKVVSGFKCKFRVYAAAAVGRADLDATGRILLPHSCLTAIASQHDIMIVAVTYCGSQYTGLVPERG